MTIWRNFALGLLLACAAGGCRAGTASGMKVQLAEGSELGTQPPAPIAPKPPAKAPEAELVPAPLPNPDLQPPPGVVDNGPRLNPALLSRQPEFVANGFAHASNLDYGLEEKEKPAAGVNLSVPVQQ